MNSPGPHPDSPRWQQWFALCSALLRGETCHWPHGNDDALVEEFTLFLRFHGIDCLVQESLVRLEAAPPLLRERLWTLVRNRAAWELRDRHLLAKVLAALAAADIRALVIKGAALAHTHYATPVSRARGDSDVWVPAAGAAAAGEVLVTLGFRADDNGGEALAHQCDYVAGTGDDARHVIDLHWQFTNSPVLAALLPHDTLLAQAVVVPALGPAARAPEPVAALLLACLHRHLHRHAHFSANGIDAMTGDRLIWIADIDRLARRFEAADWQRCSALASHTGLGTVCRENLAMAQRCFATPLPTGWQQWLPDTPDAPAARYLQAGPLGRLWWDVMASEHKTSVCLRLAFPPAAYMHRKYAGAGVQWLPWLYLRRAVGGVASRLRPGAGA